MLRDSFAARRENLLEEIDYDGRHGVSLEASHGLGAGYIAFLENQLGIDRLAARIVVEIGAGTGFLTLGLFMQGISENLIATDISPALLSASMAGIENYRRASPGLAPAAPPTHLACSFENLPLRPSSVDVMLGNSVLHHVYDYQACLAALRQQLRPGGVIVLSEPVVQGKALIGHVVQTIIDCDRRRDDPCFSGPEHARMADIVTASRAEFWRKQAEIERETANDKHLFDIREIVEIGLAAGFARVATYPVMPVHAAFRNNVVSAFEIYRLPVHKLTQYEFVFENVQRNLLDVFGEHFYPGHAFLVFVG